MAARQTTYPPVEPRVRDRWFNTSSVGTLRFAEDLCKQEFKDECDINVILQRYPSAPPRPWLNAPTLRFGDFAEAPDFLGAQLLVKHSEEQFASLPAKVRSRFNNNPVELLAFVHDRNNLEEARALGLLKAEVPASPPATPPPAEPPK